MTVTEQKASRIDEILNLIDRTLGENVQTEAQKKLIETIAKTRKELDEAMEAIVDEAEGSMYWRDMVENSSIMFSAMSRLRGCVELMGGN